MALTLAAISSRVQTEGKDVNNQYSALRESYIKDTVREMTMSLDWQWSLYAASVTASSGWVDLPTNFKKMRAVKYLSKSLQFLREADYFAISDRFDATYGTAQDQTGYYRLRFYSGGWQIYFINLPTSASIEYLYHWYTDDVTLVPSYLEEPITKGAVAKFMSFTEGDDLEVSKMYDAKFRDLIENFKSYADVDTYSEEPDRCKTITEIENESIYRSNPH